MKITTSVVRSGLAGPAEVVDVDSDGAPNMVVRKDIGVLLAEGKNIVVWNPWEDKAAGLADLADDEWRDMLCVEAGNVLGSAVRLDPGESHTLAQVVEVQELPAAGS